MNKAIILGNLTADPVLRYTEGGIPVCNFTVATNRRSGSKEVTDYFRVTAWRQRAESCAQYLHKGSRVCCWGPVTTSTYQLQDGTTRATMELTADEVEFCGGRRRDEEARPEMEAAVAEMIPVTGEDVPY